MGASVGAFKGSLIILEPFAEYFIGHNYQAAAEEKLKTLIQGNPSNLKMTQEDLDKLRTYCKTPLSQSLDYWYHEIYNPPIHPESTDSQPLTIDTATKSWKGTKIEKYTEDPKFKGSLTFSEARSKALQNIREAFTPATEKSTSKPKISKLEAFRNAAGRTAYRMTFPIVRGWIYAATGAPEMKGAKEAYQELSNLTKSNQFKTATEAWANLDERKRNYGSGPSYIKAEETIKNYYGDRPSRLSIFSCGMLQGNNRKKLEDKLLELNKTK
ncbi:MAG: hypothetical protein JSS09_03435 [Verrucomicrobia bacterium]|nr:hypothetical protein [Verrucomicrobiota bacterium]